MFFEQARQQAQEAYEKDGTDASVSAACTKSPKFSELQLAQANEAAEFGSDSFNHLLYVSSLQALTRWGGALLELAHFQQGEEARNMIREVHPLC